MVANLLLWLALFISGLSLLDLILTNSIKTKLVLSSIKVWDVLDSVSRKSLLCWLLDHYAERWIAAIWLGIWIIYITEEYAHSRFDYFWVSQSILYYAISLWITYETVKEYTGLQKLRRMFEASIIITIFYGFIYLIDTWMKSFMWRIFGLHIPYAVVFSNIVGFFVAITAMTVIALIFSSVGRCVIISLEFAARVIAESPKGPLLAIGVLLGVVAAVLKFWG